MSARRRPTRWVLPEDGIVDEIAVRHRRGPEPGRSH